MRLLIGGQVDSSGDPVPLRETAAAARGGGMLRDEDRVTAHRSLLTVVPGLGRREAITNEVSRMIEHRGETFVSQIRALNRAEVEALPKGRPFEGSKDGVQISHDNGGVWSTNAQAQLRAICLPGVSLVCTSEHCPPLDRKKTEAS
jgi:hypothetical protein